MPGGRRLSLAAGVCLLGLFLPAGATGADTSKATCAMGQAQLESGQITDARTSFSEVLATDPGSACAVQGINATTRAAHDEARACAAGDALAKDGDETGAEQQYAAALHADVESSCGAAGIEGLSDGGFLSAAGDAVDYLPKLSDALTAVLVVLAVLVGLGGVLLLIRAALRGNSPSLVMKPLGGAGDGGPSGSAMTALIQQRLVAISRHAEQESGGLSLDFIAVDVELLSDETDLGTAFADIATIPNLEFVAGLAAMLERVSHRKRYVVTGEMLVPGNQGAGLSMAVGDRYSVKARETLWESRAGEAPAGAGDGGDGASPYYRLVDRSASWVQYAVARQLDGTVRVITPSPESFAQLGAALRYQRAGRLRDAETAYERALDLDRGNVAALANLAMLRAQLLGDASGVLVGLRHALASLERRHRLAEPA